jgi:hypothetical protein
MPLGFSAINATGQILQQRINNYTQKILLTSRFYDGTLGPNQQAHYTDNPNRPVGRQISNWSCIPACLEIMNYCWFGDHNAINRQDDIVPLPFIDWKPDNQVGDRRCIFMPNSPATSTRVYTALRCARDIQPQSVRAITFNEVSRFAPTGTPSQWAILVEHQDFNRNGNGDCHATVLCAWDTSNVFLACPAVDGTGIMPLNWADFAATIPNLSIVRPT